MESFYQVLFSLGYTHPVHPTLVYLPIGGVMAAFIFGVVGALFNRPTLMTSARHCIILALIAVFPAIILGYMDWQYFRGGNWMFPIVMKMILAGMLIILLTVTIVRQWKFRENRKVILVLYTLCFFNVVAIGYFGGELVFGGFDRQKEAARPAGEKKEPSAEEVVTYNDVSAIFNQNCIMCHKGSMAPLGLQLDSYAHLMEGSQNGAVIVPGKPEESELILRVRGESEPAMPFMQDSLPDAAIDKVVRWIEQGAKQGEEVAQLPSAQ